VFFWGSDIQRVLFVPMGRHIRSAFMEGFFGFVLFYISTLVIILLIPSGRAVFLLTLPREDPLSLYFETRK